MWEAAGGCINSDQLLRGVFAQQHADTSRVLRPGIVFEVEFGRVAKLDRAADLAPDESARALEAGFDSRRALLALQMREVNARVTQVVVHMNARERDAAQSRIAQAA